MKFAVVVFPGTWSERDCQYSLTQNAGQQADLVWHRETDLSAYDCIVLPGGFDPQSPIGNRQSQILYPIPRESSVG